MKYTLIVFLLIFSNSLFSQNDEDLKNENKEKIADIRKKIAELEGIEATPSKDEVIQVLRDSIYVLNIKIDSIAQVQVNSTRLASESKVYNHQIIEFEFNSALLSESSKKLIDNFCESLPQNYAIISIMGHSDGMGSEKVKQKYSKLRAEVIKQYLIKQKNIPANKIVINWNGSSVPSQGDSDRRCELTQY
jgi:outer membrane protein OmpA-like peptidoglycan-associated protein